MFGRVDIIRDREDLAMGNQRGFSLYLYYVLDTAQGTVDNNPAEAYAVTSRNHCTTFLAFRCPSSS
jgi:hypothetical protein